VGCCAVQNCTVTVALRVSKRLELGDTSTGYLHTANVRRYDAKHRVQHTYSFGRAS
jgi:hypothetical protein